MPKPNAPAPLVIANMLVRISNEIDEILLKASLDSILPVVDFVDALITGTDDEVTAAVKFFDKTEFRNIRTLDSTDPGLSQGFAFARNELLDFSRSFVGNDPFYMLWVDSDEVHFPSGLRRLITETKAIGASKTSSHFVHFCITPKEYERFEKRYNLVLVDPDVKWEGKVHERLVNLKGSYYESPYFYHHYGYCRGQEYVFNRWYQYALLEGQLTPYVNEEVEGKTVPYFRDERSGPDKILEDRKKTLIPYHGVYPTEATKFLNLWKNHK